MENKKALSGRIQGMKFMQKKLESDMMDRLKKEREVEMKKKHWTTVSKAESRKRKRESEGESSSEDETHDPKIIIVKNKEENEGICKYIGGRRSFGHFNKEIEKLCKDQEAEIENVELEKDAVKNTVSEKEMSRRYTKYVDDSSKTNGFIPKRISSVRGGGRGHKKGHSKMHSRR
eukprot:GCRY01000760.1.p1 GENE.GCRY01000760.1~~GCRY01000760.1.p1  ORF type:complete len:175 (+),score=14.63 GCRY01000760.1:248-772(+)